MSFIALVYIFVTLSTASIMK